MLRDSAFRLMGKAAEDIEKERYKKAFEKLDKAERIAEKIRNHEISYHILLMRGFAKFRITETEEALAYFRKGLDIVVDLFSVEPENKESQEIIGSTIGVIADSLSDMDNFDEIKNYIYSIKNTFEKAVLVFEELLKSNPENPDYLENFLETIENIEKSFVLGEFVDEAIPILGLNFDVIEKLLKIKFENSPKTERGKEAGIRAERAERAGIRSGRAGRAGIEAGIGDESEIEAENEPFGILSRLDDSLMLIGQNFMEAEYFEEAERFYNRAIDLYEKVLSDDSENFEALYFLCYAWNYTGTLYVALENYDKAKECYKEAVVLLENRLKGEPENIPLVLLLANTHRILGRVFLDSAESEEDEDEARAYYSLAREAFRGVLDKYPELFDSENSFAGFFDELADEFIELEDPENAEVCYMDELQVYQNQHEAEPEDPDHILDLSDVYRSLGELFADEFETEKAKAYYEKELEIYEKLQTVDFDKTHLEAYKADVWNQIGGLYAGYEPETSLEYHEKALEVFEKAFGEDTRNEYYTNGLLETLSAIAGAYREQEEYGKTVEYYEKALEFKNQLLESRPEEKEWGLEVGDTCHELAELYSEMGDEVKAGEYHRLALESFEKIIAEYPGEEELIVLTAGKAYLYGINLLMKLESEKKGPGIAREYYEFALGALEMLYETFQMPSILEMLSSFAEQAGQIYKDANKPEETISEYEYAREKLESLYEILPETPEHDIRLFGILNNLGMSYSIKGDHEKGKECFEKALAINESLLESDPEGFEDPYSLKRALVLFNNYANLLKDMGEVESAEEYRKKLTEIKAKIEAENSEWE
ncbi:MAG: tetratricopeptide repeat protein [Methanosarcinaceae archaeon]|nr:tetratricopeptide repeat protein [Methanosarcinaceae archaeon]